MKLHFITRSPHTDSVSVYEILYMQASFTRQGVPCSTVRNTLASELLSEALMHLRLLRHIGRFDDTVYLIPLMGLKEYMLFPHTYGSRVATYAFDVWPADHVRWARLFRRHRPVVAFLSARAAVDALRAAVPEVKFVWAPEAIDPEAYAPGKPLIARAIDVLELGRRHEGYHAAVAAGLAERKKVHRYEQPKGAKIFPGHEALVRGLGDTKLLVCFPGAMTDPATGGLETMTLRYLEACAAGCLPVGHAPAEMIELFGYNPVVELDLARPLEHTLEILDAVETWQPLVRRNHARMLEAATWDVRSAEIIATLCAEVQA